MRPKQASVALARLWPGPRHRAHAHAFLPCGRWYRRLNGTPRRVVAAGAALLVAGVCGVAVSQSGGRAPAETTLLAGRAVPPEQMALIQSAALSCPVLTAARLAGQIMATSQFDVNAKTSNGGEGLAGMTAQEWQQWSPWPDAKPTDPDASVLALAHYLCDLTGQLRMAQVGGDPWRTAVAAAVAGVPAVISAQDVPRGAPAHFVDTVARYAAWYELQPGFGTATPEASVSAAPPSLSPSVDAAPSTGPTTRPAKPPTTRPHPGQSTPKPPTGAPIVNLALGHTAVASSVQDATDPPHQIFPAHLAFDGNGDTRWSSRTANPSWLYVDLGGVHRVVGARLMWETAYSKNYEIRVFNAGTWTTVYEDRNGNGGDDQIQFNPVNARWVMLYSVERGNPMFGVSLWEFQVLGN